MFVYRVQVAKYASIFCILSEGWKLYCENIQRGRREALGRCNRNDLHIRLGLFRMFGNWHLFDWFPVFVFDDYVNATNEFELPTERKVPKCGSSLMHNTAN